MQITAHICEREMDHRQGGVYTPRDERAVVEFRDAERDVLSRIDAGLPIDVSSVVMHNTVLKSDA